MAEMAVMADDGHANPALQSEQEYTLSILVTSLYVPGGHTTGLTFPGQ